MPNIPFLFENTATPIHTIILSVALYFFVACFLFFTINKSVARAYHLNGNDLSVNAQKVFFFLFYAALFLTFCLASACAFSNQYAIEILFIGLPLLLIVWYFPLRCVRDWNIIYDKMADQMQHYMAELEHAHEQALQAQQTAEKANNAKSDFLASMSHEIRTPMNGVLGMTRMLLSAELSSESRKWAQMIESSGESLLTIINDILDFSKIESEKLKLENISFHLHNTIQDAVNLFSIRALEKGIKLNLIIHDNVPTAFFGDPVRLKQIFFNLIGNALKFTMQGSVTINVNAENSGDTLKATSKNRIF